VISVAAFLVSILALVIQYDQKTQEDLRRLAEQRNDAYLSFMLGQRLMRETIRLIFLHDETSTEAIVQQQGIMDLLGLRLDLVSLLKHVPREQSHAVGAGYRLMEIELGVFQVIRDRLNDVHGEKSAAAYDLGLTLQRLDFNGNCIKTVDQEEHFRQQYEFEATRINSNLQRVSPIARRDLSKYYLPIPPVTPIVGRDHVHMVLSMMEVMLQERGAGGVGAEILSCPKSGN